MLRSLKNILEFFPVASAVSLLIILLSLPSFALSQVTNEPLATSTFEIMPEATSTTKIATSTDTTEASMLSLIPIRISFVFPDDLIYDGSIGSVGLTREQLLNIKWWGIVVYNETNNFITECISTASPLPDAVFDLTAGVYKTSISLGETKEKCEAFDTAEYPLFAVLEAANFSIK